MSTVVRPMRPEDVQMVSWLARRSYADLAFRLGDERVRPTLWTEPSGDGDEPDAVGTAGAERILRHVLAHDSAGSLVLDVDGQPVGAAVSFNREGLWMLSLLTVVPGSQRRGLGHALMAALRPYADSAARAVVVATGDPAGLRLFFRAGFDVHPAMCAEGVVDREGLSRVDRTGDLVRAGGSGDRRLCESIDRRLRGAARGADYDLLDADATLFVADKESAQGYAYAAADGTPLVVAATHTSVARQLLIACLASSPHGARVTVDLVTGEQRWAFDVCRAVGLDLRPSGPVLVRGMALPAPYLPHPALG